jgi:hypothetical protein
VQWEAREQVQRVAQEQAQWEVWEALVLVADLVAEVREQAFLCWVDHLIVATIQLSQPR